MLNVTEEDIDLAAPMITVSQTILVNLDFPSHTFAVKTGSDKDIVKTDRLASWFLLVLSLEVIH